MSIWLIPDNACIFPHPLSADTSGVLAVGGDLTVDNLLLAYQFGIFPWYHANEPILWWFPDPRAILYPDNVIIRKSMRPFINQKKFSISLDTAFHEVIENCRTMERHNQGEGGTWIHDDIMKAYTLLYQEGYAHSLEVWQDRELVGGLYGVALGRIFFGESMFTKVSNASKYGLIALCRFLAFAGFRVIDCQQDTPHMRRMGAECMAAADFFDLLHANVFYPHLRGNWAAWWDDALLG